MLRMLGFRPHPIVSLLIGAGLLTVGLVTDRAILALVGGIAVVMGLVGAIGRWTGGQR